jgi:hypothetical protein
MYNVKPKHKAAAARDIQQIISKIEYYDTPYGVPSKGLSILYQRTDSNGNPTESFGMVGNDKLISYNFGTGGAFGDTTNYFKITWEGYFYSEETGEYKFIVNKDPDSVANLTIGLSDIAITGIGEVNGPYSFILTENTWTSFKYEYFEKKGNSYTSLLWKPPTDIRNASLGDLVKIGNGEDNQHYRPVSAGVTSVVTGWMEPKQLLGYTKITGSFGVNKLRQYTISVPLSKKPESGILFEDNNEVIYYYNEEKSTYAMRKVNYTDGIPTPEDEIELKPGRLIKIHNGYQTGCTFDSRNVGGFSPPLLEPICTHSNQAITGYHNSYMCGNIGLGACPGNTVDSDDYLQDFDGIIIDFNVSRTREENTLDIVCMDHLVLAQEHLDQNYPDIISYLNTGLTATGYTMIDVNFIERVFKLENKPKTYDGWPIGFAIRDILTKSGIDPVKLYSKRNHYKVNNSLVFGDGYISKRLDKSNLPRNANFIRTTVDNEGNLLPVDDDQYLWSTNFGDNQDTILKRIVDSYGYYLQCTKDGNIEIREVSAENFAEPNSGEVTSPGAIGGTYQEATAEPLTNTLTGSAIKIRTIVDSETGPIVSGYRMVRDAGPSNKVITWGENYPYNILYGAFYGPATGISWNQLAYTKTKFGFTMPNNMTIDKAIMSIHKDTTRGGYPNSGGSRSDYCPNLKCDVYFGPSVLSNGKLSSNVGNSSYLVYSGYKTTDFGPVDFSEYNRSEQIDFTQPITTTGGPYVLEFVASGGSEDIPQGIGNGRAIMLKSFLFSNITESHPFYELEVDGLSSEFITGYTDINFVGSGNRIYNDIELREEYSAISPGNLNPPTTTATIYNESGIRIAQKSVLQYSQNARYSSDGPNVYGDYPNLIEFMPWELSVANSGGSINSYDTYTIGVSSNHSVGTAKIEAVSAIPIGEEIAWSFDTRFNISKESFTVNSNYQQIRNDVLVVGANNGIVVDSTSQEPINRNNPVFQYTFSRAIDLSSIYSLNSPFNIGRRKEFLIFEPGIKSQIHADWLSLNVLLTYNKNRNGCSFSTTAVPFLDSLDKVYVVDDVTTLFSREDTVQYIDSINVDLSRTEYKMNFVTTPYKPWPSFGNLEIDTIVTGPDDALRNISITDTLLDPVQTENLKTGIVGDKYNSYDSEKVDEKLVEVRFRVMKDFFVTCRVMDSRNEDNVIAYLYGAQREGESAGSHEGVLLSGSTNYSVKWDSIDETGFSKIRVNLTNELNDQFVDSPQSPGFYASPGTYFIQWILRDLYTDEQFIIDSRNLNYESLSDDAKVFLENNSGRANNQIEIEWSNQLDGEIFIRTTPGSDEINYEHTPYSNVGGFSIRELSDDEISPNICKLLFDDEIEIKVKFDADQEDQEHFERVIEYEAMIDHIVDTAVLVLAPDFTSWYTGTNDSNNEHYNYTFEDGAENGGSYTVITEDIMWGNSHGPMRDIIDHGIVKYFQKFTPVKSDPQDVSADGNQYDVAKIDNPNFIKNNLSFIEDVVMTGYLADKIAIDSSSSKFSEAFKSMDMIGLRGIQARGSWVRAPRYKLEDDANPDIVGTYIMDDNRIYFGNSTRGGASRDIDNRAWVFRDQYVTEKFLFKKTPWDTYTKGESNPIEKQKIRIDASDDYHINFRYNPSDLGTAYRQIPALGGGDEENDRATVEGYKQLLREVLNIAKWHVGLKRWGTPNILLEGMNVWHKTIQSPFDPLQYIVIDDEYEYRVQTGTRGNKIVDNMSLWREFLGNTNTGNVTSNGQIVKYWKEDEEVAEYIRIALYHCIQASVRIRDNSGRGLTGIKQPAKEIRINPEGSNLGEGLPTDDGWLGNWATIWYKMSNTSNDISDNFVKIEQDDTTNDLSRSVLYHGYDVSKISDTRKSFVAHAYWYKENQNDHTRLGTWNFYPSKLHTHPKALTWADPTWFKTSNNNNGLIGIHEGWGLGAMKSDSTYMTKASVSDASLISVEFSFDYRLSANILELGVDSAIAINQETLNSQSLLQDVNGPKWTFLRLRNDFKFSSVDQPGLWGISIRGDGQ